MCFLENASGWSDDFSDWLDDVELSDEELAESNRIRDHALKILRSTSLDPVAWDWPDLAGLESDECRLN